MTNPASILDSTKKALGIDSEDTSFDLDITLYINSALGNLQQLGVGPSGGFMISDNTTVWTELTSSMLLLGQVQQYVYLKVKLVFDTPPTSFVIAALEKLAAEYEWRIVAMAEAINPPPNPDGTAGPVGIPNTNIYTNVNWWVLTGLSDFPDGAVDGDAGVDFDTYNLYTDSNVPSTGYWWVLTGLSDFPEEAVDGEWGIDMDTGDVWRKTG